ncbi:MAG: hypothetical protein DMG28_07570 [Acidobacteria bacterium]|nr:MAG: hypothetical protein DMG28_07570 [Acidobacteriota bacterium]
MQIRYCGAACGGLCDLRWVPILPGFLGRVGRCEGATASAGAATTAKKNITFAAETKLLFTMKT